MTIKKISTNLIISIALAIAAVLISLKIHTSSKAGIAKLHQNCEQERQKTTMLTQVANLQKKLDAYTSQFGKLDHSEVVKVIAELAKKNSVTILSLKPEVKSQRISRSGRRIKKGEREESAQKSFFKISIRLDNYHVLGEFISDLESDPIVLVVESVDLRSEGSLRSRARVSSKYYVDLTISKLFIEIK